MLASRFPCLANSQWRACTKFPITRNKSPLSTYHELQLHHLKWTKISEYNAPASAVPARLASGPETVPWARGKNVGNNGTTAGMTTKTKKEGRLWSGDRSEDWPGEGGGKQWRLDKPLVSTTEKNVGKSLETKSLKKNAPAIESKLEAPQQVGELTQTPIHNPIFEIDSLGRRYERRVIDCKPAPATVRIYHPEAPSTLPGNKILFLPSAIPDSFFPPHDSIISTLSQIASSSTIIYPVPTDTPDPFPHSIHNLLRIYDATTDQAPTVIITSGIAATTATAMAMTEPAIKGIGIWGGIFDLTRSSASSTRWNRPLQHWEHLPYRAFPPVPKLTSSLTISRDEFKALRRHHYPDPETWLDPFASPLAFFTRSRVVFSRINLTEVNGEEVRREMATKDTYSESDWEAEVYIYPRIDMTSTTWERFPPRDRQEEFPNIRIVVPEKEVEGRNDDDASFWQALSFENTAKKGLTHFSRPAPVPGGTSDAEMEALKEAELEAAAIVKVDKLSKEVTGEDEVDTMAHWVKWVFEKPPVRK